MISKFAATVALTAGALAIPAQVIAADSDLRKATQLVERHYYESAAALLRTAQAKGEGGAAATLTLARAYARNAELYRELQHASLGIGLRYLQKIAAQGGRERSRLAALYYGEYLIESRRTHDGVVQLQRFIAQKDNSALYRDMAQAALYREIGQAELAGTQSAAIPSLIKSRNPLVRLEAAAGRRITVRADVIAVVDRAIDELRKSGEALPVRAVSNAVNVYVRGNQIEKALALVTGTDLSRPSFEEAISKTKVLRFYDAPLLGNVASLYEALSERLFEQARGDARVKPVAGYFLAELYLKTNRAAKASTLLGELAATSDLPLAFRDRIAVLQAVAAMQGGQPARGNAEFAQLGEKHAQDPILLAEVLMACVHAKANCGGVTAAARALAQTNQGERFRALHHAVGEEYAAEGRTDLALQSLETARDKANKNRIDTNDPLLLVRLADLYFASKSFSEALEIYFELGKEFPAVRQLQEVAQGVYATEYRSAGDVKIF